MVFFSTVNFFILFICKKKYILIFTSLQITLNYFKKFNNCVLVFIKDTNLKSVTQTLKDYKNKDFYKKGKDKLIRNYGIGAQIIKDLKIKNMTLITKSPKKVIGLDGYGIRITKQEII